MVARRATAAVYRRSRQARVARQRTEWLVDSQGTLPEPRLEQQLAVHLADRLPGVLVRVLGVRGLRVAAWLFAKPLRVAGRLMGVGPIQPEGRP